MAEAFAKIHGQGRAEIFSAGSKPSGIVNPKAIEGMKELGYDLTTHQSKSLDEVMKSLSLGEGRGEAFEYVVTMGCGDECPFIPAKHRLDWAIPEPKHLDKDEFRKVRDLIGQKVKQLLNSM